MSRVRQPRVGRKDPLSLLSPLKSPEDFAKDVEFLRAAIAYEPETGVFRWKARVARQVVVGAELKGDRNHGYVRLNICNNRLRAHLVAWVLTHGALPTGVVDHINADRGDNRLRNLRDVPPAINDQNRRHPKSSSQTGLLGVSRNTRAATFRASVKTAGKVVWSGCFPTPEAAHAAYVAAKRRLHEGCTL